MRLAASNLAWPRERMLDAFRLLRRSGFEGIEIAPTKVWPEWRDATPSAGSLFARRLLDEGFVVPALQAVLHGVEDVRLFGSRPERTAFVEHLVRVADLAAALNAPVMIVGAPSTRRTGCLSDEKAWDIAVTELVRVVLECAIRGVVPCLEPVPRHLGCDFVTSSTDAIALVQAVPGLGLHLDAAALWLSGEDAPAVLAGCAGRLLHFHASQPDLASFDTSKVDHESNGRVLWMAGYQGWVSLEMCEQPSMTAFEHALGVVRQSYGEPR